MEKAIIKNLKETKMLAKKFAKLLIGGETVLLNGDLGAGKTTFIKYVLQELGVKENITSPTFTIMHEYKTKKFDIYHFDMYRLSNSKEAIAFGIEEYLFQDSSRKLIFIEWAENISDIINDQWIKIHIKFIDENKREFEIIR